MTQTWEKSEFPILCESCLGPNPYTRMLKDDFGKECKVCGRPYTSFKWSPTPGARWLSTQVCQTCAKIKNACQTCILDLEYHIHTSERDAILKVHNAIPMSDVNSQVYVRSMEQLFNGAAVVNHGVAESAAKEVLKKLVKAAAEPYQRRNRSSRCAFYVKGNCKRDKECPFLHEMADDKRSEKHGSIRRFTDDITHSTPSTIDTSGINNSTKTTPLNAGDRVDKRYRSQNPGLVGSVGRKS